MWHFLRWVHSSQTKFRPSRCWSTNYMISSSTAKFRPYPLFAKFFNQYDFYSLWFSWMNLSTYEIKVLTIDFQDFSSLCLNNLHRKIFYFWLAMRNVVSSVKMQVRSNWEQKKVSNCLVGLLALLRQQKTAGSCSFVDLSKLLVLIYSNLHSKSRPLLHFGVSSVKNRLIS